MKDLLLFFKRIFSEFDLCSWETHNVWHVSLLRLNQYAIIVQLGLIYPTRTKQTIHYKLIRKASGMPTELGRLRKKQSALDFSPYFIGIARGWIAWLFPWRSCDIWLESLWGVFACLFLSCLKCLQLSGTVSTSNCEACWTFPPGSKNVFDYLISAEHWGSSPGLFNFKGTYK